MAVAAHSSAQQHKFIRPSSKLAMEQYEPIAAAVDLEICSMTTEIGFLNCHAGRKAVGTRLDKCLILLEIAEKTAAKDLGLFIRNRSSHCSLPCRWDPWI